MSPFSVSGRVCDGFFLEDNGNLLLGRRRSRRNKLAVRSSGSLNQTHLPATCAVVSPPPACILWPLPASPCGVSLSTPQPRKQESQTLHPTPVHSQHPTLHRSLLLLWWLITYWSSPELEWKFHRESECSILSPQYSQGPAQVRAHSRCPNYLLSEQMIFSESKGVDWSSKTRVLIAELKCIYIYKCLSYFSYIWAPLAEWQ